MNDCEAGRQKMPAWVHTFVGKYEQDFALHSKAITYLAEVTNIIADLTKAFQEFGCPNENVSGVSLAITRTSHARKAIIAEAFFRASLDACFCRDAHFAKQCNAKQRVLKLTLSFKSCFVV